METNGNGKKYSNPPTTFKPRGQYKFIKVKENHKFSCEKCKINLNDEDEVSKNINEFHEKD